MQKFDSSPYTKEELLGFLKALYMPRLFEEKMLILLRQGKISKWFSGIGQEAIAVGATMALLEDEMIFPMHRNLGVFTCRNVSLEQLMLQFQGKEGGFTKGRDRSFHFGSSEHRIAGMISHLGPQLSLATGTALAHKLKGEKRVSLAFTGEGGTSQGEFHEALNLAAVWELPVIFLIENNGYGLSTPVSEQYRCENLSDKGMGYGMKAVQVDGNDILAVHNCIKSLAEKMRNKPEPVLVEALTFRLRGHEEASGTKYVPQELMDTWDAKDPVSNFEKFMLHAGHIAAKEIGLLKDQIRQNIDDAVRASFEIEEIKATSDLEIQDLFQTHQTQLTLLEEDASNKVEMRFVDSISMGLQQALQTWDNLVIMGQDIAEYGGVFKITEGLAEEFGKDRLRNTPLCESAVIGAALGLSMEGIKSVVEMQFADFVSCGFNQIVNNLAKIHYRWGQNADVVIRMPCGAGVGAGPFHSQSNEAWFCHTPGLKVVYPSNPDDAKALLLAAIDDPNPVLFFEHKALYRSISGAVEKDLKVLPIGKAKLLREGKDAVIITYGMGVHWALKCVASMKIDVGILDLRSLAPIDWDCIGDQVIKCNRVLILHEDVDVGGIGGDIAAFIADELFEFLDAPVVRISSLNTPVPFAKNLEDNFLASSRLEEGLRRLLGY